ncbi:hypothetical protein [Klebsiella michiganensis]|uniref:hypothetical protein n=1 Tax=Klebsiella michiganensis TaxID=1134687 RepID=UPI002447EF4B|nr:hypothetical protein [Klebsiella michiganensis]MDH1758773.1 hypothetical protein [Klebsiella michiganensis]
MGEISVKTGNNARNGGKNSLNRLIRCVCGKKIGPDPRNFNQRVSLGRNDLLIRTFPKFTDDNEIYVEVKGGVPTVYFYQKSVESDLNTVGWAGARFAEGNMVISSSTIRMVTEDTTENIFVGERISGKKLKFEKDELVPLSLIDDNGFNVNCNQYLDVNAYRENGLPYYSEPDPEGRKGIEIGYPTTIFAVGELGICSAFLDDDIVPQIKNGWIQFRRLN